MSDAALAELREANRRRDRLIRRLRVVHRLGERPSVELTIELATRLGALEELETLAERYASRLTQDLLRAVGGERFPAGPIRIVAGASR